MATRHVIVSEKTLEINVAAELLERIRSMPGCANAFWIGMKQQQEAVNGIDDLIMNVPAGQHLALQFKAPRPNPSDGYPFAFPLNYDQLEQLRRLAARRPKAVLYALPPINTFSGMRSATRKLVDLT